MSKVSVQQVCIFVGLVACQQTSKAMQKLSIYYRPIAPKAWSTGGSLKSNQDERYDQSPAMESVWIFRDIREKCIFMHCPYNVTVTLQSIV